MRKIRLGARQDSLHEEAPINLTPLIDVVFVVLIMFIIIAPMLELDHVQLAPGAQKENREMAVTQDAGSITIHVHQDNSIWLNKKLVGEQELLLLLKEAHRHHPHRIPQLFHDKSAHFGTYQTVKNTVELSGFEQMDVILVPS